MIEEIEVLSGFLSHVRKSSFLTRRRPLVSFGGGGIFVIELDLREIGLSSNMCHVRFGLGHRRILL